MDEPKDTLPAPAPCSCEIGDKLDSIIKVLGELRTDVAAVQANQTIVNRYLRDPATHRRLLESLPPLYEPEPSDEVTQPGE